MEFLPRYQFTWKIPRLSKENYLLKFLSLAFGHSGKLAGELNSQFLHHLGFSGISRCDATRKLDSRFRPSSDRRSFYCDDKEFDLHLDGACYDHY
jgi:hypothetical protein